MMKFNFKTNSLLFGGLLTGSTLFAQAPDSNFRAINYVKPFSGTGSFRTFSIGVEGGVTTPYTVFGGKGDYLTNKVKYGFSGFVKQQILPALGVQADVFIGRVQGKDASVTDAAGVKYSEFDTKVNWALSGSFVYTFANINWREHRSFMQPYASLGGGAITYTPAYTTVAGQTNTLTRGSGANFQEFFIPLGVGTKISLSPGINVDLGYTVMFVNADNFDALNTAYTEDRFSYGHIGLEFVLGSKKKPQLATFNPASSMYYDYTMQTMALRSAQQDILAKQQAMQQDMQAKLAAQKAQNDALAASLANLTKDTDGDGVPDLFDKCPNTPTGTKVDGSGCPLPQAENVKVYITEEDKKVVKDAIANLEFDLGKATIRDHSFPSLDKVADLLVSKNFSLKLAGHTDNSGSANVNMRLSKDRAEAIKTYLVSKGANASRIEATGYGMTQPIASNKTAKGRQQNRRVEFTLF